MPQLTNREIAERLDEMARRLDASGAGVYRARAYSRAAEMIRAHRASIAELAAKQGAAGLRELPGVGEVLARQIAELARDGTSPMLARLRREGGAESGETQPAPPVRAPRPAGPEPSVEDLLAIDRDYRAAAAAGTLKKIAPKRLNPTGEAWLPVMHTTRGAWKYTVLFSNTARAHEAGKTHDWVVFYFDDGSGERQRTVVTATRGTSQGKRVVKGREGESGAPAAKRAGPRRKP